MNNKVTKIIAAFSIANIILADDIRVEVSFRHPTTPYNPLNVVAQLGDDDVGVYLTGKNLENAKISGNTITCEDEEGEAVEIRLFKTVDPVPVNIELEV